MAGSSPQATITTQCITAQSADETLGPWIDVRGCAGVVFFCSSTGTTSSGVISFEEMLPSPVTGQPFGVTTGGYSLITTQAASAITGGLQIAVHLPRAAYGFVRARISTAIGGGGTVSVGLVAY